MVSHFRKRNFAVHFCIWMVLEALVLVILTSTMGQLVAAEPPVPLIFDTDMVNDVDDVLALGMIRSLQSRGECELLAVTITKDHKLAAPFTDAVNTFDGRGAIPIEVCRSEVTNHEGKFNHLTNARDGAGLPYPHDLISGKNAPDSVAVLRQTLTEADEGSVVIVQVGFSTNLANLFDSKPDQDSSLHCLELVE